LSRLPRAAGRVLAAAGGEAVLESSRAGRPQRVHAVRVAAKKLRTYWRVLRPALGRASADRRGRALSRAARVLAGERERDVLAGLARKLSRSEKDLARPLAGFARRRPAPGRAGALERRLRAVEARLADSERELERDAKGARRRDLRKGLKRLERKLERARERARRKGEPADIHRCRKRAKDLKYVFEAFGMRPKSARRFGKAADELGDARDLRTLASRAGLEDGRLEKRARKLERSGLSRL